ncbi:MAG: hypothetical protein U9N37_03970 [Thermodesulfobacteriota bacterium]|nr:hypothetical protein [Thermodesulfobacteriota bacterium]
MSYWGYYPRYVSVAEKKAKAAKKIKQLRKKNPNIRPVIIEGRAIATTWWGKSWNVNLERYADYENRIGRGRSYVRHGTVLDLRIEPGKVTSLVQGTASKPYSVTVNIKELPANIWKEITVTCEGKLDSIQELLMGKFPKTLNEIFTAQGKGLFPSPEEISFSCSCPDWADMCKHVAATLYGIGARLDEEPNLFFKLRKVEMNDLISRAVEDKTQKLLKKAQRKSSRVIDDSSLSDVFGIDLEDNVPVKVKTRKTKSKIQQKKTPAEKPVKVARDDVPPIEVVAEIIKNSKKGVGIVTLRRKSGFDEKKIYNLVHRLKKQGQIKNVSWGVYAGV